jgi:putative transposase
MSERRFCRIPGGVCSVSLHCVRCPKYRRQILGGCVAARCGLLLAQVAVASAQVVRAFTGRTAWALQQEFSYLRRLATVWWSPSYVAASIGDVSESTVHRSIEHQWDEVAS